MGITKLMEMERREKQNGRGMVNVNENYRELRHKRERISKDVIIILCENKQYYALCDPQKDCHRA